MNNEILFLSAKGAEKNPSDLSGESQPSDFIQFFNDQVEAQRKADAPSGHYPEQASDEAIKNPEKASGDTGEEKSEEATNFTLVGRELPKLMLHERGLEVGRIILTPQSSSISNKSLSDFMRNQSVTPKEQPASEARYDSLQKDNKYRVNNILGVRSSDGVDSSEAINRNADFKLEGNKTLQQGLGHKSEKDLQENAKKSAINRVIQRNLLEPEKFSKPGPQSALNTNNPVFESFEKQLNSRLALVNSTISGQKPAEIDALSEKVAGRLELRALEKQQTKAHQTKSQASQTSTETDLAIKNTGEFKKEKIFVDSKEYLKISSKKSDDQISNKLFKEILRNSSGKISVREDLIDPLKGAEKLTIPSITKPSAMPQEIQPLSAKEIATVSEVKPESRPLFREVTSGTQQVQQNQLETVIQKFSEALGSRMISAIQQNNWNLQLKLNPASLGEINVALEFNDGNLEGKLYAADETTRALLHESLSKLKHGLKEGLENYQSVDVFIGERRQNPGDGNNPKNSNNQELELELGEELVSKTHLANLISTGRVDIQV